MHLATQNAVDEKYSSNDLSLFRSPTERNFCGHAKKNFSCDKRMHQQPKKCVSFVADYDDDHSDAQIVVVFSSFYYQFRVAR